MILIWHGAGILVAVIWFGSVLAGDKLATALFGPGASPGLHNLTGEWLAAGLTLVLALALRTQRVIGIDPQTGAPVVSRPNHSLFWIPVIVWPVIFFVLGIVVYYRAARPEPVLFEVTPAAVSKIKQEGRTLRAGWSVRLEAYCQEGVHEPQYEIVLGTDVKPDRDYQFRTGGVTFVVLQRQVELLRGARLDVADGGGGQKFRVTNPNLEGKQLEERRQTLELERPRPPKKEEGNQTRVEPVVRD